MFMQTFFKEQPTLDTPYRQLALEHRPVWRVRLVGGTKWGPGHDRELKVIPANGYIDGKASYDKLFGELMDEGWKPYNPFAPL